MALAVFLRAANVGGHAVFKPSEVAKSLADFDVKNIGAAGTFAVRASVTAAAFRPALGEALPIDAPAIIVPAKKVLDLVATDPMGAIVKRSGGTAFVSALVKRPTTMPSLPLAAPAPRGWSVRIHAVLHPFVLSERRAAPGEGLYPNEVVEKTLGVAATSRTWATLARVAKALQEA